MVNSFTVLLLIGAVYIAHRYIQLHLQGVARLLHVSPKGGMILYAMVFFPGVLLHETSHFLVAAVCNVRTGAITLLPPLSDESKVTTLGSVQVAKTDVFRASLIGAAPFLIGTTVLYFLSDWLFIKPLMNQPWWQVLLATYFLFVISNTMFSSREDTHAWPMIIIIFFIVSGLLFLSGNLAEVTQTLIPFITTGAERMKGAYLLVLGLDIVVVLGLYCLEKLLEKLTHQRIRYATQ